MANKVQKVYLRKLEFHTFSFCAFFGAFSVLSKHSVFG